MVAESLGVFSHGDSQLSNFAQGDIDLETGDTERTGAAALMIKKGRADTEDAFGFFFIVEGVPLGAHSFELAQQASRRP